MDGSLKMAMQPNQVLYIGDGVYLKFDGYAYELLTGSHDNPENRVVLEPEVLKTFLLAVRNEESED
jgi:hypothetical protein